MRRLALLALLLAAACTAHPGIPVRTRAPSIITTVGQGAGLDRCVNADSLVNADSGWCPWPATTTAAVRP